MAGDTAALGKMVVELLLKDEQFQSAMGKSKSTMKVGGADMVATANEVGAKITSAFKVATAAIVAFGAASTVVGANFEQQMAMVGALQGLEQTDQAFQDLQAQARLLGSTTEFTATEAAGALENLARAGATVEESIQSSNAALTLAGTSASSLADSTQLLVSTQRQFGLQSAESERITNVFSLAMRKSLLDFTSVREAMKFAGTAGASFGMTLEETTASVAAFRDMGLEGSLAGTNFRMAMIQAAKGTDQQGAALKKYGLTLADISPEQNTFIDIVEKMADAGITASDAITVFGSRAGANMAQLANETRKGNVDMRSFAQTLGKASEKGNTAADMYQTIGQTVAFASKIAVSSLQDLMIEVFDTYAEPLRDLITTIPLVLNTVTAAVKLSSKELGKSFGEALGSVSVFLRENAKDLADAFVNLMQLLAAVAPLLGLVAQGLLVIAKNADLVMGALAFGTAILAAGKLVAVINGLAIAFGSAGTAVTALGVTMTITTGGFFALVVAAGAIIAALVVYVNTVSKARSETDKLRDAQEKLAAHQSTVDKQRAVFGARLLENSKAELASLNERKAAGEKISNVLKQEVDGITKMTAAQLGQKLALGEMLLVNGKLRTVQGAMTLEGMAGHQALASAVADTKRKLETYAAAVKSAPSPGSKLVAEELLAKVTKKLANLKAGFVQTALAAQHAAEETDRFSAALDGTGGGGGDSSEQRAAALARIQDMERQLIADLAKGRDDEQAQIQASLDKRLASIDKAFQDSMSLAVGNAQELAQLEIRKGAAVAQATEIMNAELTSMTEAQAAEQAKLQADIASRVAKLTRTSSSKLQDIELAKQKALTSLSEKGATDRQKEEVAAAFDRKAENVRLDAERRGNDMLLAMRGEYLSRREQLQREKEAILEELTDASAETQAEVLKELNNAYKKGTVKAVGEAASAVVAFGKAAVDAAGDALGAMNKVVSAVSGGFDFDLQSGVQGAMDLQADQMDAAAEAQEDIAAAQAAMVEAQADGNEEGEVQAALDLAEAREALGAAEAALAGGGAGFAADFVNGLFEESSAFIAMFVEAVPMLLSTLAEGLPALLQTVTDAIPAITQALVDNIPIIIGAIMDALPGLIVVLVQALTDLILMFLDMLPSLIVTLMTEVLPTLISSITQAIPVILTALIEALPLILGAVIDSIPILLGAVIDSLPVLISALIEAIPILIGELIAAIPQIVVALLEVFFLKLIPMLPRIVAELFISLISGMGKALKAVAEGIWDAIKDFFNIFKRKDDDKGKKGKKGKTGSFSGINYVPATTRMTIHQGEAVIPADRNAQGVSDSAPAPAGAAQNGISGGGGGGGSAPLDIAVMVDGRLIDAVQVRSMRRGNGTGVQREIRRAGGVRVGLDRGKFNPWSKK